MNEYKTTAFLFMCFCPFLLYPNGPVLLSYLASLAPNPSGHAPHQTPLPARHLHRAGIVVTRRPVLEPVNLVSFRLTALCCVYLIGLSPRFKQSRTRHFRFQLRGKSHAPKTKDHFSNQACRKLAIIALLDFNVAPPNNYTMTMCSDASGTF